MSVKTSGSRLADASLRALIWGFIGGLFGVLFIVAHDALAPVSAGGTVLDPITKTSLPIPALPSLRLPPLVRQPSPATAIERHRAQD